MSALLPCEWCAALPIHRINGEGHQFGCSRFVCDTRSKICVTEADAADAWNRRTPPLPTREEVARVICSHQMSHNSKGEPLFPSFAVDDPLVMDECDIYLSLADAVLRLLGGEKNDG